MKLIHTLYAAAAVSAFALPAAAQDVAPNPAPLTPPVAQSATPPAEQTTTPPATAPMQPAAPADAAAAQQPTAPAAATPQAAAAADLTAGAQVFDAQGQPVGTIAEADATGAVLNTGNVRGRMNLDAFYKNERGLLVGYSRAEFEALVTGMGGPETPDAEDTAQPAAPEQPAAQPEAANPPAATPDQPER